MKRKQKFFMTACTLTASSFLMRLVGMAFNLYLSAHVGSAGVGRFSLVMSVYGFAVCAASAGIGLSVTRVTAEADADCTAVKGSSRAVLRCGLLLSAVTGGVAALLLYTGAPFLASVCLHDTNSIPSLRTLALSLPPLAMSAVFGGYFVARRRAPFGAVSNITALFTRILASVLLLRIWSGRGDSGLLVPLALSLGCLVSEYTSLAVSWVLSFFCKEASAQQVSRTPCIRTTPILRAIVRIAFPIAVTACIRSGLGTLLHLLIPRGLLSSGLSEADAFSVYGTVHGIALPMLLVPTAFLQSVASLLIPEVAACRTKKDSAAPRRWENRILRDTLYFSFFAAGIFYCHAEEIAGIFCDDPAAARYLRMLAPLLPIMNLDTMVDAFLKGLDEQVASMRYNIIDAAYSVLIAFLLLPQTGALGYVILLYTSETLNLALSITKLHKVSPLTVQPLSWIVKPLFCLLGAVSVSALSEALAALCDITFRFPTSALIGEITASALLYLAFLAVFGNNFGKTPSLFRKSVVQ